MRLWLLKVNLKCCQCKSLDEQVFIYNILWAFRFRHWLVCVIRWVVHPRASFLGISTLVEARESGEEFHNLRLGENVRENTKVMAELRKAIEVHQAFIVCIVLVVRDHCLVDTAQNLNNWFVSKDFHQLLNMKLRVLTASLWLHQHTFSLRQVAFKQYVKQFNWILGVISVDLLWDDNQCSDELLKLHSIFLLNLLLLDFLRLYSSNWSQFFEDQVSLNLRYP